MGQSQNPRIYPYSTTEKTAKNGAAMGMTLAHNPLAQGPHTPAQACTSLPKAFVNTHLTTHHTRSQFAAAVASTHHTRGHFAAVLPASSGVGRVPTLLLPTSVGLGADVRIYACTQHAPCSDHGCVSGARFSPLVATSSKVHRALVATSSKGDTSSKALSSTQGNGTPGTGSYQQQGPGGYQQGTQGTGIQGTGSY